MPLEFDHLTRKWIIDLYDLKVYDKPFVLFGKEWTLEKKTLIFLGNKYLLVVIWKSDLV